MPGTEIVGSPQETQSYRENQVKAKPLEKGFACESQGGSSLRLSVRLWVSLVRRPARPEHRAPTNMRTYSPSISACVEVCRGCGRVLRAPGVPLPERSSR